MVISTYDYAITNIANATSTGIGLTAPYCMRIDFQSCTTGIVGLGFINGTDFVLIHAAIPTDATYFVNYTNNPSLYNAVGSTGRSYSWIEGSSRWCVCSMVVK